MIRVVGVPGFDKRLKKSLNTVEQRELKTVIEQLKRNPVLGTPLTYPFFREIRIGGKRVYFLTYLDIRTVLLVSISNKKGQQKTIDKIKSLLPAYRKYVHKISTR